MGGHGRQAHELEPDTLIAGVGGSCAQQDRAQGRAEDRPGLDDVIRATGTGRVQAKQVGLESLS